MSNSQLYYVVSVSPNGRYNFLVHIPGSRSSHHNPRHYSCSHSLWLCSLSKRDVLILLSKKQEKCRYITFRLLSFPLLCSCVFLDFGLICWKSLCCLKSRKCFHMYIFCLLQTLCQSSQSLSEHNLRSTN